MDKRTLKLTHDQIELLMSGLRMAAHAAYEIAERTGRIGLDTASKAANIKAFELYGLADGIADGKFDT